MNQPTQTFQTICLPKEEASLKVAHEIAFLIENQALDEDYVCLGLPTGRTPYLIYEELARISNERNFKWERVKCFALDEYLDSDSEDTFHAYLYKNLYSKVSIPSENCFNPAECDDYDGLIAMHGGLDLTILGVGGNGHIAFNEPGTSENSWTHCVWLTDETLKANKSLFKNPEKMPSKAVTMGVATIVASRKIKLVAFGENKKQVLKEALKEKITSNLPVSYLQKHSNLEVYTDFSLD